MAMSHGFIDDFLEKSRSFRHRFWWNSDEILMKFWWKHGQKHEACWNIVKHHIQHWNAQLVGFWHATGQKLWCNKLLWKYQPPLFRIEQGHGSVHTIYMDLEFEFHLGTSWHLDAFIFRTCTALSSWLVSKHLIASKCISKPLAEANSGNTLTSDLTSVWHHFQA